MKDKVEIYHAATEIISQPMCGVGRKNLDFGPGFSVYQRTDVGRSRDQASPLYKTKQSDLYTESGDIGSSYCI